jgi:transcriptional regulator GlxA family with amidase domain
LFHLFRGRIPWVNYFWAITTSRYSAGTTSEFDPPTIRKGVTTTGVQVPVDEAETVLVCGFLGCDAVLERLAEMMFVDSARRYLDGLPEDATGWLAGLRDRFVGKALALMHERPEQAWSVDELAREIGLSRSALHERFVQ